ncbi:hypothetical protein PspLS_08970 [Pyricularia sp. CBS 133598]|nr:hypothetical protein PspLS_08970 [Pyricularia sp. CBS 133598]
MSGVVVGLGLFPASRSEFTPIVELQLCNFHMRAWDVCAGDLVRGHWAHRNANGQNAIQRTYLFFSAFCSKEFTIVKQ